MLEQSIEETRTRIKAMKEEEQSSNMKNEPTVEKSVASDDAERDSKNQSCAPMDEIPPRKPTAPPWDMRSSMHPLFPLLLSQRKFWG
jgi:hypothetical protein